MTDRDRIEEDPHPTPKSGRTLTAALSIEVLEGLGRVEMLCKTAVVTGEKVLDLSRDLLKEFEGLKKQFEGLEKKNRDLEARVSRLEERFDSLVA